MALLTRTPARASAEDFLEVANMPEYADCRVELVEGEIVTMPTTNSVHAELVARLVIVVGAYIVKHRLGRIYAGDAGFVLERNPEGRDTVRGLDIAFISREKAPDPLPNAWLEVAPDLVIEVISPGNTADDTRLKVRQLLRAGCAQVWVVYPNLREVDAHSEKGIQVYREGDTLACPDILPGFEIAISDIFPG